MTSSMFTIRSRDGTPLAYAHTGAGAPLALVHGTGTSSTRWLPILPALKEHFSLDALDRRGRGASGDAASYALEREAEDVASLIDFLPPPVNVLGHSFGGLCALEAALLTPHIHKLILYEPPIPVEGVSIYPAGVIDQLEALLAAGDRAGVLMTFMQAIVRRPPHELQLLRAAPDWSDRLAAAHTLPRELRALAAYQFNAERFYSLRVPTLLLLGEQSPFFFKAAIDVLAAALPNNRVASLPGQQHIAMDTAPELFVREVIAFLDE